MLVILPQNGQNFQSVNCFGNEVYLSPKKEWYDARFCPQNTILTLDYPILKDISELSGADAIYEYVNAIRTEQLFLQKLDRTYVKTVLLRAVPGYRLMIDNICEIVMINTIGHIILRKSLLEDGFTNADSQKLKALFCPDSLPGTKAVLNEALKEIAENEYNSDIKFIDYFANDIDNMAVRINTAIKTDNMEKVFVL